MALFRKNKIGRASIKESFDNLPSGICFADYNGLIILCNRQMFRLCYTLIGMDLQHISELQEALDSPKNGVHPVSADGNIYRFPDDAVWKFTKSAITDADGNAYTQVQAVEVTALYEKEAELEKENSRLEEVNARAKKLYSQLDSIVREEENFAVKTHVHDEMGELLGKTRKMLSQRDFSPGKLRDIGKRWEQIGATLGTTPPNDAQALDTEQTLARLREAAAGIGIKLLILGEFPEESAAAKILTAAVRECAINTVRHAKGDELTAELTSADGSLSAAITNNGAAPAGEIIEGGGLSALRRRIESAGGGMRVESAPRFRLVITLPKKEEE